MAFSPRLNAPSYSSSYWYSANPFYQSGYGLPNCTCYAWGRFYEISGARPKLSLSNAENWYGYHDGYGRGNTPKLGAVICWRRGRAGYGADGAGHVAIVEKINADGSIVTSNSAWKGTRFYLKTLKPPYYSMGSAYSFQGFIYNPAVSSAEAYAPQDGVSYKVGMTYTLQANMKVRTGAGTGYRWKKRNEITEDGRKNAQSGTYAVLKKGTRVTCRKVVKHGSEIWIKIPSGYVCARMNSIIYVR